MKKRILPIDLGGIKTHPFAQRQRIVSRSDFGKVWQKGAGMGTFFDSLPGLLAAGDLKKVIAEIVKASKQKKTVMVSMGAHVIKVGLNPIIIDLMQRGIISAVALNGAGIIHDLELALFGQTSEDVAASIGEGSFGMAHETCAFLTSAVELAASEHIGLGEAVGRAMLAADLPYARQSILAVGVDLGLPITVHVAIGTDIIHMHPAFDGAKTGAASHRDFRLFAAVVATLEQGVYLNIGSAVILPEVFLKAVTLVRNLGQPVKHFLAVNMDFIRHYRPMTNVVSRPTAAGGRGINLVGHHEIMLPLIAAGVIEGLLPGDMDDCP